MLKRKNESSHQVYMLDTMNNLLGVLVFSLILALVVDGTNQVPRDLAKSSVAQLKARLQAVGGVVKPTPSAIKQRELAVLRARKLAEKLQRELLALRSAERNQERLSTQLSEQIKKTASNLRPAILAGNGPLISESDVDRAEDEARRDAEEAAKLAEELDALLKAEPQVEQEIQLALARVNAANSALGQMRSKADLEEDLSRVDQLLEKAKQEKQKQLLALKVATEAIGGEGEILDLTKGREAATEWAPKSTLYFVCRNHEIVYMDTSALMGRFVSEWNKTIEEIKSSSEKVTWDEMADRVNSLGLENGSFTLRAQARHDGLILTRRPKFGPEWEDDERLNNPDSSYRHRITSADRSSVGVQFFVWEDSFDTYQRAVSIAKKSGFRTRWIPYASDEELDSSFPPGGDRVPTAFDP